METRSVILLLKIIERSRVKVTMTAVVRLMAVLRSIYSSDKVSGAGQRMR